MNRKTESIRVKQLYGIFLAATLLLGACTQEKVRTNFPKKISLSAFQETFR